MSNSKHAVTSKTNMLGFSVVGLAIFNIFQDYNISGMQGISETDIALLISGFGVIWNRVMDKHGRKLHFIKPDVNVL